MTVAAAWTSRHKKTRQRHPVPIVVSIAVVVVLALSLVVYLRPTPTSNSVFCGMLRYAVFSATTINGGSTVTENLTETSVTTYTTNTSVAASFGHVTSSLTTYTPIGFIRAGNETICTYISRSP